MKYYCVMTFNSTYHALQFEKILKKRGFDIKLMPVPRKVSSSCGTAGKFPCEKKNDILKICNENDIELDSTYKIEKEDKKSLFSKFFNK